LLGQGEHALRNYFSILKPLDEHTPLGQATGSTCGPGSPGRGRETPLGRTRCERSAAIRVAGALDRADPARTLTLLDVAEPVVRSVFLEQTPSAWLRFRAPGFTNVRDWAIIAVM
jgi:hypothetical protein